MFGVMVFYFFEDETGSAITVMSDLYVNSACFQSDAMILTSPPFDSNWME
jgi:hypothetical protein